LDVGVHYNLLQAVDVIQLPVRWVEVQCCCTCDLVQLSPVVFCLATAVNKLDVGAVMN
jgi:hypothetical protein